MGKMTPIQKLLFLGFVIGIMGIGTIFLSVGTDEVNPVYSFLFGVNDRLVPVGNDGNVYVEENAYFLEDDQSSTVTTQRPDSVRSGVIPDIREYTHTRNGRATFVFEITNTSERMTIEDWRITPGFSSTDETASFGYVEMTELLPGETRKVTITGTGDVDQLLWFGLSMDSRANNPSSALENLRVVIKSPH